MPTRRGITLLAAGILLLVSGRALALIELGTVGLVLIGVVVSMTLLVIGQTMRARFVERLTITRTHPPSFVFANRPFPVTLQARGRHTRMPLCEVAETVRSSTASPTRNTDEAPTRGRSSADEGGSGRADERSVTVGLCRVGPVSYQRRFVRGTQRLGPGQATIVDTLGLARLRLFEVPSTHVIVWPEVVDLDPDTVDTLFAMSSLESDTEPGDLREYVAGDDLRRVHWATSARAAKLMVRGVDRVERPHEARKLVLDMTAASYRGQSFELALSVAASLLASADPDEHIDLVLDGPSGSRVYPTLGLAMAALANAVPDVQRAAAQTTPSVARIQPVSNGIDAASTRLNAGATSTKSNGTSGTGSSRSDAPGSTTAFDWGPGIAIVGENADIPTFARGPIIRCSQSPGEGWEHPGQVVISLTSLADVIVELENATRVRRSRLTLPHPSAAGVPTSLAHEAADPDRPSRSTRPTRTRRRS